MRRAEKRVFTENPEKINSCSLSESLCRDVHTGTSPIIIKMPLYRRASRRVSKTSDRFLMIYQPLNIALQNPYGSHNRHCVQRPESCGLHDSTNVKLPRSIRNETNQPHKNQTLETLELRSPPESATPALENSR